LTIGNPGKPDTPGKIILSSPCQRRPLNSLPGKCAACVTRNTPAKHMRVSDYLRAAALSDEAKPIKRIFN
jgi:hypothetical protein